MAAQKVLMFGWEFPPFNSGGLGVACEAIVKGLLSEGKEVTFVLPKKTDLSYDGKTKIVFADDDNLHLRPIGSPLTPYIMSGLGNAGKFFGFSLAEEVIAYAKNAAKVASSLEFDIIHAHDWLSFGAGLMAREVSGKPMIAHIHSTEYDRNAGQGINEFIYKLEKEGLEKADYIIAVSNFTKNIVVEKYGIDENKISVVHNGGDPVYREESGSSYDRFQELKSQGYKIVLYNGRITIQKGPDYFVKAAKRVLEKYPKTLFFVSGSGDMMGEIMNLAATLGIAENISFLGFTRGEDLKSLYKSADLFVMPSVSEPFGIVPLESLHEGTPVLISHQSGVSEVLSHALKTDFWDIDDMASKIIAALHYPALSQQLSREGKSEAMSVTWQKASKK
ncbi:MAG: glycosyltransferase family 4 protein [Candidatus Nomurabacteria bacterium]|nr:MAG: glycosyltransferase family 4 protein [Candidatus Nomurabacteria bacterium]